MGLGLVEAQRRPRCQPGPIVLERRQPRGIGELLRFLASLPTFLIPSRKSRCRGDFGIWENEPSSIGGWRAMNRTEPVGPMLGGPGCWWGQAVALLVSASGSIQAGLLGQFVSGRLIVTRLVGALSHPSELLGFGTAIQCQHLGIQNYMSTRYITYRIYRIQNISGLYINHFMQNISGLCIQNICTFYFKNKVFVPVGDEEDELWIEQTRVQILAQ